MASTRTALANSELPEPAKIDLRSALRELEQRLKAIEQGLEQTNQAMAHVDPPQMRARLNVLTAEAHPTTAQERERDQLARMLSDIEALDSREERLSTDIAAIENGLIEVSTMIGQADDSDLDVKSALSQLTRAARLGAESVSSASPPKQSPPTTKVTS